MNEKIIRIPATSDVGEYCCITVPLNDRYVTEIWEITKSIYQSFVDENNKYLYDDLTIYKEALLEKINQVRAKQKNNGVDTPTYPFQRKTECLEIGRKKYITEGLRFIPKSDGFVGIATSCNIFNVSYNREPSKRVVLAKSECTFRVIDNMIVPISMDYYEEFGGAYKRFIATPNQLSQLGKYAFEKSAAAQEQGGRKI